MKNGTVLRYVAELSDGKRKVLYVDTEQSPYHCLKVMKRILRMAGLPDDRDNENLEFLALRKYTPEQRIKIVEQAIYNTPDIGLVIIDGIRDASQTYSGCKDLNEYLQKQAERNRQVQSVKRTHNRQPKKKNGFQL